MESHVLIPDELVLTSRPLSDCSSPSVARLLEQRIIVSARKDIEKGSKFHSVQGTIKCGKLEVYSTLAQDDVRMLHGGLDEIEEVTFGHKIRRANWIRFLSLAKSKFEANLLCFTEATGQMVFEVTEDIPCQDEIKVFFNQSEDKARTNLLSNFNVANKMLIRAISSIITYSPIDLSTNLFLPCKKVGNKPDQTEAVRLTSSASTDSGLSSSGEDFEMNNNNNNNNTNNSKNTNIVSSKDLSYGASSPYMSSPERPSSTDTIESSSDSFLAPPSIRTPRNIVPDKKNGASTGRKAKKMLPCDFCGKCFDRPSLLNRHLRTHTGERPHVCDICEKGFSTSSSLNTHKRIHSGEKPHQCGVCGKRFTASSNLYYHRMTHIKEKPHKCELCQKSFPTPGDLKSHMYIHNGSWPHRCPICDRGFSKVTNLKNHLFLHTGQKPHECVKCGKRFALGCNMKAHMKTHENNSNTSNVPLQLVTPS